MGNDTAYVKRKKNKQNKTKQKTHEYREKLDRPLLLTFLHVLT